MASAISGQQAKQKSPKSKVQGPKSGERRTPKAEYRMRILLEPSPHPGPLPSDGRRRTCSSVGRGYRGLAVHVAAPGDERGPNEEFGHFFDGFLRGREAEALDGMRHEG